MANCVVVVAALAATSGTAAKMRVSNKPTCNKRFFMVVFSL